VATCVTAADVAVKTSDVTLVEIRLARGLGGKAFALVNGDVAAVQASVESAVKEHKEEGMIAKSVVIPSIHKDLLNAIM
jgi:microcompartment protein CcmL/EutN